MVDEQIDTRPLYQVEIILDSISGVGKRLTTMRIAMPRFILAEFNTHRQFSRNSASSRAIPTARRIAEVRANPFVPEVFTANRRGMQGGESIREDLAGDARQNWINDSQRAADSAEKFLRLGVHKQYANRIIELYLWQTVLVSSTEWSNFFAQRCHPDAQPEIQKIAYMMRNEMCASVPQMIDEGDWHMPFIFDSERSCYDNKLLQKISVARCARVSYTTNTDDGSPGATDPDKDLELFYKLQNGNHMSPFEHVAAPAIPVDYQSGNFFGWRQLRKYIKGECA